VRGAWRRIAAAPLTGGIEVTAPASFATNSFPRPAGHLGWPVRDEDLVAGGVGDDIPASLSPWKGVAAPARGANEQWDQCQPRPDH